MSYLTKRLLIAVGMVIAIFVGLGFRLLEAYSTKTEEPVVTRTTVSPYVKFLNPILDKIYVEAAAAQEEREELINKQKVSSSPQNGPAVAMDDRSERGDCEDYRSLIASYDWPVETAMEICKMESGGNPNALNTRDSHSTCTGSYGLLQIGCLHAPTFGYTTDELFVPGINVQIAYNLWKEKGFSPWTTYKKIKNI